MPGTSSVSGLVSGMDTDGIISKLLELERIPIRRLETQKQMLKAKLTAWQDANTRILALKTKAELLANSSTFDSKLITSDDESIIKGKANYNAQTGTYFIRVDRLARAHQEKSDGYTDISSIVGTGK
ncbi:MAG TPA: flagellar cap protein FliD N-terminal domain-containing protein, partial [Armatimonadota bacterium]|nr:flagellar cap protein FliD N-terminal domain-containing protein [Armatimonadota bacterium]